MTVDVRSPLVGPYPTLTTHVATRGYVDTESRDVPLNTRTANYTLALSDRGRCVQSNSTSALTFTVPPNASVAFPIGASVWVRRYGSGGLSLAAGTGVTLRTASSLTLGSQYQTGWLHKVAVDEWVWSVF